MDRAAKREAGLCWSCSRPAAPRRARCEVHLKASRRATRKYLRTEKGAARRERAKPYQSEWRRRYRRGRGRFDYVKRQVVAKGVSWQLSRAEFAELVMRPCHYCRLANDVEAGRGLDRLDNTKGYTPSNVVPCCSLCNMTRGARFTPREMVLIGRAVRLIRQQRRAAERLVAAYVTRSKKR